MNYRKGETLIETILSISILLSLFISFNYIYTKNVIVINKYIDKIEKNIEIDNIYEVILNQSEENIMNYDGYKVENLYVKILKNDKEYTVIIGNKSKKKVFKEKRD